MGRPFHNRMGWELNCVTIMGFARRHKNGHACESISEGFRILLTAIVAAVYEASPCSNILLDHDSGCVLYGDVCNPFHLPSEPW